MADVLGKYSFTDTPDVNGNLVLTATTGLTGPAGASPQVQYNNAGVLAGANNVNIDNGDLLLDYNSAPTLPPANSIKLFGQQVGGRNMVSMVGGSGIDTAFQPHFGRNKISLWNAAGNSTTITTVGTVALTASGTATAANVATTNIYTYQKKVEFLVTTAATTAIAGWRYPVAQWTVGGTATGLGGFHFVTRFGPSTGVATASNRCFVGMSSSIAAPTDVQPSSQTNMCGLGWDSADANIQFMYNGTGTTAKIDLGSSFPVPTVDRSITYEIAMFSIPGTTQSVGYQVTILGSGGAIASGTVTTNLPATNVLLAPRGWMSAGGTSSVIGIAMISVYIESDY